MTPLLKWPGGKRLIASRIARLFPSEIKLLREPFVGSAAVFLRLRPKHAVLSDANAGLINFHKTVRDSPNQLFQFVQTLPLDSTWKDAYYDIRAAYNEEPREGALAAARLLWLNRTAFNGLYRENAKGGMNAPAGDYKAPNIPALDHILAVSDALQDVSLKVAGFEEALAHVEEGDCVYLDPPYDPLNPTSSFATYSKGGFGWAEQEKLAGLALRAANKGASVVASNHGTDRIIALYSSFQIETFELKRSIGCTVESRAAKVTEILVYAPASCSPRPSNAPENASPTKDAREDGAGVSLPDFLEKLRSPYVPS